MASEPPFAGRTSAPFGAHHSPFPASGRPAEAGTGVASFFGGFGDGQESPSSNPFAFVGSAAPPVQGNQQNFMNPSVGPSPSVPPTTVAYNNPPGLVTTTGAWLPPNPEQHHAAPNRVDPAAMVSHPQYTGGVPNTFSSSEFGGVPENLMEDPFESLHNQLPRSWSSQAQSNDITNAAAHVPYSGSSSAPVTGVVGSSQQEYDDHMSLGGIPALMSLPMSSSGSSIERPPLSPVMPPPASSITNATLPTNQCLPLVQSYPDLPPTNATNAAGGPVVFASAPVPQHNTNALANRAQGPLEPNEGDGLTMQARPAGSLEGDTTVTSNRFGVGHGTEMTPTEKDYLALNKDRLHMRGVGLLEGEHSLSSLNHSMSSLLDSQENIAQQFPVKILPPAPEARPLSSPQPSQQFPPPKTTLNPEHTAPSLNQVAPGVVTAELERPVQTHTATLLPPPPNTSLPVSTSVPPQAVAGSQQPSAEYPKLNVVSPQLPPPSSQVKSQREEVGTLPENVHPNIPIPSVPLSQTLQSHGAPQSSSILQPPLQMSSIQPQAVLQPSNAPSVLPAPRPELLQALPLHPQAGLQQPPIVSSVLPPPHPLTGSSGYQSHLTPQERTNAHVTLSASQDGAVGHATTVQHPPNFQQEFQQTMFQPTHLDGVQGQTLNVNTNPPPFGTPDGTAPPQANDGSNLQPMSVLPSPATQDPLFNELLTNAQLTTQSQHNIPSNAHLPPSLPHSVPSNAHPPSTDASMGVQGALSNAHLSQFMPRALVSGVQPPPLSALYENIGTQPQHMHPATNTAYTMVTPLTDKPPHPHSVPLHQAPINDNLPSTPDSVFTQATSEAPPAPSNVATGLPGAPAPHSQTLLVSAISAVPPRVNLTQAQVVLPPQPSTSVPSSQVQSRSALAAGSVPVNAWQPQAHVNSSAPPVAPMTSNPWPTAAPVHTSAVASEYRMTAVPSVQPLTNAVTTYESRQALVHSHVTTSTAAYVSGSSRTNVTAPVTLTGVSAGDHLRQTGEQQHIRSSVAHHPPLPPSSSHHQSHHVGHPVHHPAGRDDGRSLRHTAELRHRERYDPYYGEDPYEYDRHGHYYEDPYYGGYYRPQPGSRAPHTYYPDPYEQDQYAPYYRQVREYDPYTGKYYYVEDPYGYPSEYEVYHPGYYEHPRELVPTHAEHMDQNDSQMHTHDHTLGHPPTHGPAAGGGALYPDQSTIDGPQEIFEEGGTFFESPDARGSRAPRHATNAHHMYPNTSHYGPEHPVQPDWGSTEPPAVVQPQEPLVVLRRTPEQFACPHVRASFAPGGTLVVVLPHNTRAFQRPEVELSHVTELVSDSVHANFVRAVSEFPGPLMPGETPKSVAVSYATKQAEQCRVKRQAAEENEEEVEAAKEAGDEALLWEFLVLLCQQNGVVVASDISELLTREKLTVIPTQTHMGSGDQEDALESIRQLLIVGRKRDALELACSQCLWGHALMLASKMDEQSRTYVINRFTASLVTTDPLSTFYTLMLGRTPSAVKPEGLRRAGSWRPHLAMILANRTSKLDNSSIVTLGDSLLESGRLCAAHFCYHLADIAFGEYGSTNSKYMLLGTQNGELAMGVFPRPEHLRKMEVFEYAMSLGKLEYVLPHFQVFKYILALQLTQFGMVAKAFKYCEQVAVFIGKSPGKFSPTLLHVLDELSTKLHHLNHPHGVVETELPSWLLQLQQVSTDMLAGNYTSSARSTPSPTFSSVSQAYAQPRQGVFAGQSRNQYLRVPGATYKAGSVDSSTATSSKEGSVVGVLPAMQGGPQEEVYQPSNLLVSQQPGGDQQEHQPGGYTTQEQGQPPPEALYSQTDQHLQASEEVLPAPTSVPGADGTTTGVSYYPTPGQTPYGTDYSTAGAISSGGATEFAASQAQVQYTSAGSAGDFGVASTSVGNEQPQAPASYGQPQYGATSDGQHQPFQQYPTMHGDQQGTAIEQPQLFGYTQPPQSTSNPTQGYFFQPNIHPAGDAPASWGTNSQGQELYMHQTPGAGATFTNSGFGGGTVDTNDRNVPAATGDTNVESHSKADEEEEKEKHTSKEGTYIILTDFARFILP